MSSYKYEVSKAMKNLSTYIGETQYQRLKSLSAKHNMTMSRLLAIALMNVDDSVFDIDFTLPKDVVEYAYSDEAYKILNYMSKYRPMTLDMLYVVMEDIGINTLEQLLGGFSELVRAKMLIKFNPKFKSKGDTKQQYWAVSEMVMEQKLKKEAQDFGRYERLKRKFEKKEETKI